MFHIASKLQGEVAYQFEGREKGYAVKNALHVFLSNVDRSLPKYTSVDVLKMVTISTSWFRVYSK